MALSGLVEKNKMSGIECRKEEEDIVSKQHQTLHFGLVRVSCPCKVADPWLWHHQANGGHISW